MIADDLLNEQRILISRVFCGKATSNDVQRLAEVANALDRWMIQKRETPKDWVK